MPYLEEPEPEYGVPHRVVPGVRRVVARNPGPMTYWGTNTYLIDMPDGVVVLDPGPSDAGHIRAVLDAAGGQVSAILLSHAHHDHVGALPALRAATNAPTYAWPSSANAGFAPDVNLRDGGYAAGLLAVHTPGHASDHLCFAREDGTLFSADHVMTWSSSVVSPPDGNMAAYVASLSRLLARDDRRLLPGHGPPMEAPRSYIQDMLRHRMAREAAILNQLQAGPRTVPDLADALYDKLNPRLQAAAQRNVAAHLEKLESEGLATQSDDTWHAVTA